MVRALESSDLLYREMKGLYEAFGQNRPVYAEHVGRVLREY
jgi:hypothetical protein